MGGDLEIPITPNPEQDKVPKVFCLKKTDLNYIADFLKVLEDGYPELEIRPSGAYVPDGSGCIYYTLSSGYKEIGEVRFDYHSGELISATYNGLHPGNDNMPVRLVCMNDENKTRKDPYSGNDGYPELTFELKEPEPK